MPGLYRSRTPSESSGRNGRTTIPFTAFLVFCLFAQLAKADDGETTVSPWTSAYQFLADKSTITQTGGVAGIHRTYTITGTFQLTTDFEAGTASFDQVDANTVNVSLEGRGTRRYSLDPNQVFNMTDLAGTIVDRTTIRFEGTADDGSSVLITLAFADDTVTLKGETTPPPNSADFFLFSLDAVAEPKYEYGGGSGTADDPYQIATSEDLIILGDSPEDYHKHFILTEDIDLDPNLPDRKVFDTAVIAPHTNPNDTWSDFQGTAFAGVFDGNGHTISHLTITGGSYVGLFGQLASGAEVMDIGVVDVNVTGSGDSIGGLVGSSASGIISDCYSTGVVSGTYNVGGLVGENYWGQATHCYSTAQVSGTGNIGGLIGYSRGTVSYCRSTGAVDGGGRLGGLIGYNRGNLSCCYSTAVISGSQGVGGLVGGHYDGSVSNSYSAGSVWGNDYVGGLVGHNQSAVTSSYSNGEVTGQKLVGGLVGWNRGGTVTRCFWDWQTAGQTMSAGGTGKTTAEMQTAGTFLEAGWDFVDETANGTEDVWWILEGKDYPRLWWQLPEDDFEDGKAGPLWFVYEVDPSLVQIEEVNGRLETVASAEAQNVDAFYVSDGWRLEVTKEFAIRVDFHFSKQGGGDGRVTLGVTPSLDPSARKWAEFEAGCFETGPFYLYEVRDGFWVQEVVADRFSDDGTLYMSYDPDTDELYFSFTGYGKANAWQTVTGLLKGRWASEPVYVILGGGSEGMALTGEDAWLDNLVVSSGLLVLN